MLKIIENVNLKELENYGFKNVTLGDGEKIFYKPKKTKKDVIEIEID